MTEENNTENNEKAETSFEKAQTKKVHPKKKRNTIPMDELKKASQEVEKQIKETNNDPSTPTQPVNESPKRKKPVDKNAYRRITPKKTFRS